MFMKIRQLFIIVTAFIVLGIISGCVTSYSLMVLAASVKASDNEDVTSLETFHGESIWKSYKRDGIYQLKRNLLYGKVFEPNRDEYELFPPWDEPKASRYLEPSPKTGEAVDVIPKSIEEFRVDPTKWGRIKGAIPKGTKLKMERVIYESDLNTHNFYYIAVFIDGPFAGKPVFLNRISIGGPGVALSYDREYLEHVNAP